MKVNDPEIGPEPIIVLRHRLNALLEVLRVRLTAVWVYQKGDVDPHLEKVLVDEHALSYKFRMMKLRLMQTLRQIIQFA